MKNKRRSFLKKSAIAGTGFFIVPRNVLGGNGYISPSDQLNIAAIGAGGKGNDITHDWASAERVIALCDVHPDGSHGVTDSRKTYPNANFYVDFREMLDNEKDLDAVTISTPDHTHAVIASNAMNRGLHVYVQKPLTHNIEEARALTKIAAKNKVVTQMGNQGGSSTGVVKIQEWVDKKLIGKIHKIYAWTNRPVWPQGFDMESNEEEKPANLNWDLWLGPAASTKYTSQLHPFNWRGWWDYGTGALGDMGCHILDAPYKTLGLHYPTDVECSVGQVFQQAWSQNYVPKGCPASSIVTLNFDKTTKNDSKIELIWMDGGLRPSHPEFIPADDFLGEENSTNGVLMIGETGVISCGVYGLGPKLYRKGQETIEFSTDDYWKSLDHTHHMEWINGIKAGYGSDEYKKITAPFEYAGPFTETVLMGNLAIRSYMSMGKDKPKFSPNRYHTSEYSKFVGRKKLLWDGENMKITNFDEANKFVGRSRRSGWNI
jgi:predicted dehydrogenase